MSHPPDSDHLSPLTDHQYLGVALNELLIEKGLYSEKELHQMIESIEMIQPQTHGAQVIAKAWSDQLYRQSLLTDANSAVAALGLDPGSSELQVLENTDHCHHVVVCTLCSCYPRALLGRPPAWYKSREYRARMVYEPRQVLQEFGTRIPLDVAIKVHDSTAERRYLVMPKQPAYSKKWIESRLTALITRDSMIGVATV